MTQTRKQIKIAVPPLSERLEWQELGDLPFDAEVIMEIVQRYCDSQDHAKNYRLRRQEEFNRLKALEAAGQLK